MSAQLCVLYVVNRTDLETFEVKQLSYAPTDFLNARERARYYQRTFDPQRKRFDYRVAMVG